MRKWELEVLGEELLNVWALDIIRLLELDDLENVDRPESRSVTGGHILVESFNSIGS